MARVRTARLVSLFGAVADHYVAAGGGGGSYSAAVLADGPLAYYRLGDSSGTTMTDSSGNGRNGTYAGSPTLGAPGLVIGDTDTAVTFNGTSQQAQVPYGSWMNTTSLTLEAIIKPTSVTGFPSREAAKAFCEAISASGKSCFVK